jgi:hypothetical protein
MSRIPLVPDDLNLGAAPDDGTGSTIRAGGQVIKDWITDINAMTLELYNRLAVVESDLPQFPMAVFDGDYLWNNPLTNTAWTASDTTSCTFVGEIRTPALPTGANWTLVGVGAAAGAPHPKGWLQITSAGEVYVAIYNSSTTLPLYYGTTTDAALVPDTRYMIHAVVDTTDPGDEIRVWVNGVEKSVTITVDQGIGSDVLNWSSTAPGGYGGGRRGSVGIKHNAVGATPTVVAESRVGYIDGGSGDVPVEIGLGFFSTAAIADPTKFYGLSGVELSAYVATAPMILGHVFGYGIANFAAGVNAGTGPDLTVGP